MNAHPFIKFFAFSWALLYGATAAGAATRFKLPPPYQATYEYRINNHSVFETQISDGKGLVRDDDLEGGKPHSLLMNFRKNECVQWNDTEIYHSQLVADIVRPYLKIVDLPQKGVVALGPKQIRQWKCHGYRLVNPRQVDELWLSDDNGILVRIGADGKTLVKFTTEAPPSSDFAIPKDRKDRTYRGEPLRANANPRIVDPNKLPRTGKQVDGSTIELQFTQFVTRVITHKPDGSTVIHDYKNGGETEKCVDADERLVYQWVDFDSYRSFESAPAVGPMIWDQDMGTRRIIRLTNQDGSFLERTFVNGRLLQDGNTKSNDSKTIVADPAFVHVKAGFMDFLRQTNPSDHSISTSVALNDHESFAIITKDRHVLRTESQFGDGTIRVLSHDESGKPLLTTRPVPKKTIDVQAPLTQVPAAPPFPRQTKYFKHNPQTPIRTDSPTLDIYLGDITVSTTQHITKGRFRVSITPKKFGTFAVHIADQHLLRTDSDFSPDHDCAILTKQSDGSIELKTRRSP